MQMQKAVIVRRVAGRAARPADVPLSASVWMFNRDVHCHPCKYLHGHIKPNPSRDICLDVLEKSSGGLQAAAK
jgi:hypothetical protein